ncbi:unnamed protein product [Aphanomyces euteiches]
MAEPQPTIARKLFREKSTRLDLTFLNESNGDKLIWKKSLSSETLFGSKPPAAPSKRPPSLERAATEPKAIQGEMSKTAKKKHKDSPHMRLYTLGVHLLDHKDQVHNMFSHYTTDITKGVERRRSRTMRTTSPRGSRTIGSAQNGNYRSFDDLAYRMNRTPMEKSSVRSTIKHLRRKLSQAPLVEVSRKSAPPIEKLEKHQPARPGVSPIRVQKSPTRLQVVVVPRRPSLYGPNDDNAENGDVVHDDTKAEASGYAVGSSKSPPKDRSPVHHNSAVADPPPQKLEEDKVKQLMEQINLLKSTLGLTDEDLQWKVESAKTNAFLLADKKLAQAEEEYDRLLYEQSLLIACPFEDCTKELTPVLKQLTIQAKETNDTKATMLALQAEVSSTKKNLMDARVSAEMKRARSNSPPRRESVFTRDCVSYQTTLDEQKKELLALQEKFKQSVLKQDGLQKQVVDATEAMVASLGAQAVRFTTDELANTARKLMEHVQVLGHTTGDGLAELCEKATEMCKFFQGYQAKELSLKEREINATLKQIEIWRTRREQAKEFPVEMKRLEVEWKAQHAMENHACFERLCSLIPETITTMSVEQLVDGAKAGGVLYTRDLANYLKQNKSVDCISSRWIVTHDKDKSRENFITGDSAQCFTNFEAYDITEMRGLFVALPEAFEFDKDGRKAEWRLAFVAQLKLLVQQQRGECVKAGWDPVKGARAEVKLKSLTEKQLVNPMYRYPTESEIQQRLERFETQAKRLAQKKARMQVLINQEIPLAKKEYHAVAEDARSEELLKQFGKPALIKLRDESKKVYHSLCKECDTLKGTHCEIAVGERAAQTACPTYEQYVEEIAAIRQLSPEIRSAVIRGPFNAHPVIKPKERAVHKKLSVEEEAAARKHELSNAIAERSKEFGDQKKTRVDEEVAGENTAVESRRPSAAAAHIQSTIATVMTMNKTIRAVKASPAVLNFLQNEFCNKAQQLRRSPSNASNGPSPEKPTTTLTSPKMGVILDGDEMQDEAPESPPPPPMPKSHALLKLMGLSTTPVLKKRPSMLHDPDLLEDLSKPNMLAEIQRRRSSKGTPPPSPPIKKLGMSLLDELKKASEGASDASKAPNPGAKPLNFLEELMKKAKSKE